jgi:hypothetical protein
MEETEEGGVCHLQQTHVQRKRSCDKVRSEGSTTLPSHTYDSKPLYEEEATKYFLIVGSDINFLHLQVTNPVTNPLGVHQ